MKIAVAGTGYVGLSNAVAGSHIRVLRCGIAKSHRPDDSRDDWA
ncbi:hypothetical protein [Pseudoxanthomonas suwonensis]|nr:hypothetical protein [Pseudoxanthomonas suwonensis]